MKFVIIKIQHSSRELPWTSILVVEDRQVVNTTFVHIATEQYLRERFKQELYLSRQYETERGFGGYIYTWDIDQEKQTQWPGSLYVSFYQSGEGLVQKINK